VKYFIDTLRTKSEVLFYFGLICLVVGLIFLLLTRITQTQVLGINAWIKPAKFALSTWLYAWAMGWYCQYLVSFNLSFFEWSVVVLLGLEIAYIAFQASRGQLSHFNLSTPVTAALYSMMAIAATLVTVYTAFVAIQFVIGNHVPLPDYYAQSIQYALWLFVVFAFEGFVMGSKLTHTIGGAMGGKGLPFLNWSTQLGDPRVAHFIGMHALQVLPIIAYYFLKDTKLVLITALLYGVLAIFTLMQALDGRPFIKT
jgi:hypothetical protein